MLGHDTSVFILPRAWEPGALNPKSHHWINVLVSSNEETMSKTHQIETKWSVEVRDKAATKVPELSPHRTKERTRPPFAQELRFWCTERLLQLSSYTLNADLQRIPELTFIQLMVMSCVSLGTL